MKNAFLTTIFIFIRLISFSQITLEVNYPTHDLKVCNFTNYGYKYYLVNQNQIIIYNLDHSIFTTINITSTTSNFSISNISDNLFDLDNLIEFVLVESFSGSPPSNGGSVKIVNENNSTLFSRNIIYSGSCLSTNVVKVANTYKLKLFTGNCDSTSVLSLPGTLPCDACGGPTGIIKNNSTTNTMPNAYPNPTSMQITIPYTLANNDTKGKINIYDINGKILREYNVDNTFENLILDTQVFIAGTYYYNLTSNSGVSDAKKIIVIK